MRPVDAKQEIRNQVWQRLRAEGASAFPGAQGRIPNFVGAAVAAETLAGLEVWKKARTLKCNPDMPQRPVRKRALEEGKVLYMPVPRLTSEECFLELDPARIEDISFASSIKGAFKLGRPVHPRDMARIDLIVCGAVAARPDGSRLGKGGGYSDLEYALALSLGLISHETPVTTTVHPIQIVDAPIPMTRHDLSLDYVATPEEVIRCTPSHPRPLGIYPEELGDKGDEIPILRTLVG